MSDYLIRHIAATPNIKVRLHTHITNAIGDTRLAALEIAGPTGTGQMPAAALFVMIGAAPNTDWLPTAIMVDDHGFILTAGDLPREAWPDKRPPFPFETSTPGVFAVGDARHGSTRRVAGAVGEGSVAVGAVLQYLASGPT
jgi:thioredoxin reductase (NADPH)